MELSEDESDGESSIGEVEDDSEDAGVSEMPTEEKISEKRHKGPVDWCSMGLSRNMVQDTLDVSSFEMQVIDMEMQNSRMLDRFDPTGQEETSARCVDEEDGSDEDSLMDFSRKRKKFAGPRRMVPVIRIYGRAKGTGASVRVNVYGFYPKIHVLTTRDPSPDENVVWKVREYVSSMLKTQDAEKNRKRPFGYDPVLECRIIKAFPGYPFVPAPRNFIEITLAYPEHVRSAILGIHRDFADHGYSPYTNIDTLTQFQVETGIHSFYWVKVVGSELVSGGDGDCYAELELNVGFNGISAVSESENSSLCHMRAVCFDIECLKTKGMPNPQSDAVILVCGQCVEVENGCEVPGKTRNFVLQLNTSNPLVKPNGERDVHICFENERDMLNAFFDLLVVFDPDFLVGHNHVGFDIPYITTRAHTIGSTAEFIGRRGSYRWQPSRPIVRTRKSGETRTSFKTDTPGRIQVDTMLYIQKESRENSYRLDSLAQKYLGSGKDDVGYNMIAPLHARSDETRSRLASYCLKDSILTWGLCSYPRFNMLLSIISLCKVTCSLGSKYFNGVQEKIWMLIYKAARCPGFDAQNTPALFPYIQMHDRAKDDKYGGATVWPPKRGYYTRENKKCSYVCVADFASLYPSIIVSKNFDMSTQLKGQALDHIPHCQTPVGAKFVTRETRKGLLPMIVENLLQSRSAAKKEMAAAKKSGDSARAKLFDGRQLAIKIAANSVYGITGAGTGGKLPTQDIAESVTKTGREMIAYSVNVAEGDEFGATVIYGDTDSIMFYVKNRPDMSKESAFELLDKVCAMVTAHFPPPVALQAEKLYENMILINKKRYVGLLHAKGEQPKLDFKGLEMARRDNCPLLRETMAAIFDPLVKQGNPKLAGEIISKTTRDLLTGNVPVTKLFISKSISKLDYANPQVHLKVVEKMKKRDPSYSGEVGERIPFVIIENGCSKVCEKGEDPLWAIEHECQIDYKYYLEKQIVKAISRIMSWVVGDRGLIKDVALAEEALLKAFLSGDQAAEERAEKDEKKRIAKLQDSTEKKLFGASATCTIPRSGKLAGGGVGKFFKVTSTCPACRKNFVERGYCEQCKKSGAADENRKAKKVELEGVMSEESKLREKCKQCRGYESEEIKCVQRDCPTLYERAAVVHKIKTLTEFEHHLP
jgi:DNA polymerase delta subunit 1